MGATGSKRWLCMRMRNVKVIVQGLPGSGKSSLIHFLRYQKTLTRTNDVTAPIGIVRVGTIEHAQCNLECWDIPSEEKMKSRYYDNTHAVIYVVDCCDKDRVVMAEQEIQAIVKDEQLQGVPLLVLANKQDVTYALSATELTEALGLNSNQLQRQFNIKPSSTISGAGLTSAVDWLVDAVYKTHTTTAGDVTQQVPTVPADRYRAEMVTGVPDLAMTHQTAIGGAIGGANNAPPAVMQHSNTSAVQNGTTMQHNDLNSNMQHKSVVANDQPAVIDNTQL